MMPCYAAGAEGRRENMTIMTIMIMMGRRLDGVGRKWTSWTTWVLTNVTIGLQLAP